MELNGIINLLKPPGTTSHDAVSAVRRITGIRRTGHTGTLDPMATGVLPVCVGKATRIIEYLDQDTKKYRCEMQLGIKTDTQDIWGKIYHSDRTSAERVTSDAAAEMIRSFVGVRLQIPPKYSAIKVDGKRLYEYARSGKDVEIKSREIEIFSIEQIRFDEARCRSTFDVHCSKGTYVRTICEDIGDLLGCGAAMSFLSRKSSGAFSIEDTVTIEELEKNGAQAYIKPADYPLTSLPAVEIPPLSRESFGNGMRQHLEYNAIKVIEPIHGKKQKTQNKKSFHVRVYCGGDFMGIAKYDRNTEILSAEKVLFK